MGSRTVMSGPSKSALGGRARAPPRLPEAARSAQAETPEHDSGSAASSSSGAGAFESSLEPGSFALRKFNSRVRLRKEKQTAV